MANKTFTFHKNVDNITASYTITYSGTVPAITAPTIENVPRTSGDIIIYEDWLRTGYTFLGWDTAEDGTGVRYEPGDSVPGFAVTNLYAQWESTQPAVTISYNNNIIFTASTATGTQILTTQNSFLVDNITVQYAAKTAHLQSKTVTPALTTQIVLPDTGYTGLSQVTVSPISPTKNAATYTPTTTNQIISAEQWLKGDQTILGDVNLVAGNIKNGVSIFNVTGTYTGGGGGGDFTGLVQRTLTSVSDNNAISYISDYAFYYYSTLTTISFPSCTTIGNYAFYSCFRLANISFPICTTIGSNAFGNCSSLTTISFSTCTNLGSYAFDFCSRLTTASFPVCITINEAAFRECYSLTNISFPSCTTIGGYAFQSCSRLTNILFPSCTNIGASAFQGCSSLTTVSFPACISIGSFAFGNCNSLTTVSFPACTSIGSSAFRNCSINLLSVEFPVCSRIYNLAFFNCYQLTTVSFPKCTYIYSSAFAYCYHLLSLYLLTSNVPTLGNSNVFFSSPISTYITSTGGVYGSIFVKQSLLASFQTAPNWSRYSARMVGLTDEQIAAL